MKKGLIIGLVAAAFMLLAFAAGALAYTTINVLVDTQGYTLLEQMVRTDFVLDVERAEYTPFDGAGEFDLFSTMTSVPTTGWTGDWDAQGGLTATKFIDAYGGTTDFSECAVSGGYRGANGFISEYIHNEGEIHIVKSLNNLGEWNLLETKVITGSGFTIIEKDLGTWGYDSGSSLHPTDAQAYIAFDSDPSVIGYTDGYFNTGEGGFYVTELPSYSGALGWCFDGSMNDDIEYFESTIVTDEPFVYFESVGVDPYWPDIEPPERPVWP